LAREALAREAEAREAEAREAEAREALAREALAREALAKTEEPDETEVVSVEDCSEPVKIQPVPVENPGVADREDGVQRKVRLEKYDTETETLAGPPAVEKIETPDPLAVSQPGAESISAPASFQSENSASQEERVIALAPSSAIDLSDGSEERLVKKKKRNRVGNAMEAAIGISDNKS
jgi:hypothetical protein